MNRGALSHVAVCCTAVIAAMACAAIPASAVQDAPLAPGTVIHVATTGTDAPGCGAGAAPPCQTIGYAFSVRAVSGDTIQVAAGTYNSANPSGPPSATSYLLIDKTVHFEGAQAGKDPGGTAPPSVGQTIIENLSGGVPAYLWYADANNVTIDGFTFKGNTTGAGVQFIQAPAPESGFLVEDSIFTQNVNGLYIASDGTFPSAVRNNLFDANNAGGGNGIYVDHKLTNTVIEDNTFRANDNAPVEIDDTASPLGRSSGVTITRNDMNGEAPVDLRNVSDSSVTGNSMAGGLYSGVQVAGGDHAITVAGNNIEDKGRDGVIVGVLDPGLAGNTAVTVERNSITRPGRYGIQVFGSSDVRVRGNLIADAAEDGIIVPDSSAQPSQPSSGVTITQNTITGSRGAASGIHLGAGGYTGPMTISFNRIVFSVSGYGLVSDDPAAVIDARDNWWGCNQMPSGAGCDHLAGTAAATISFSPWLILRIHSVPASILASRQAGIFSDLQHDSAGALTAGPFFAPVNDHFTATPGHVRPVNVITTADLHAPTTWPAGQSRPAEICSTIDNQTVCLHFAPLPTVDIHVTKTAAPSPFIPGLPLTYTLTITNSGPSGATGVTVTDPAPVLTHASWTCASTVAPTRCARRSGTGSLHITADIAARGHVTYTITGTVPRGRHGTISNTATVTPPPLTTDNRCHPSCKATARTAAARPHVPVTG